MDLLNVEKVKHHIISIGTEECLRSIPASTFKKSKKYWKNLLQYFSLEESSYSLRKYLADEYCMIAAHTMNALNLAIFVHKSILGFVKGIKKKRKRTNNLLGVEANEVRTGLGGTMGNKGAIGITFRLYGASFLFINCHLACKKGISLMSHL